MVRPQFSPVNCPLRLRIFVKTFHMNHYCVKGVTIIGGIETTFCLWSFLIILFSQNNQPTLDWKFKNDWTKQSGEVTHASIYLTNCRSSFIFSVTLFRAWFYDNQFSKTKFNLMKILEVSQEHTHAMLVKLQSFILQFNRPLSTKLKCEVAPL